MQVFDWNAGSPFREAGFAPLAEDYHNWHIEIIEASSGFVFQCYPPDLPDFLDAGEEYQDYETALQAARCFVDREIAIRALLELANEWWWLGLVTEDEYWNLTNFA
jgi:hypothetical protein